MPANNMAFWHAKFEGTRRRDRQSLTQLRQMGWRAIVVWECQTRDRPQLEQLIRHILKH